MKFNKSEALEKAKKLSKQFDAKDAKEFANRH